MMNLPALVCFESVDFGDIVQLADFALCFVNIVFSCFIDLNTLQLLPGSMTYPCVCPANFDDCNAIRQM